jgi:peptidoglycan/LPS O-acetylase OafA/YrhL
VLIVLALSRNRITVVVHAVLAAAATALVIAAVRSSTQIAHGVGTAGGGRVLLALLLAIAVCVAGALLTGTGRVDRVRVPRRIARAVAIVAVAAIVIAGVAVGPHLASKAWHSFDRTPSAQASTSPTARLTGLSGTRYQLWQEMLKAFQAHPIDGIGAGTTEFWWNEHATNKEFVRDAHNIWIQNLAELGIPGFLLIVSIAGSALWVGIAVRRRVRHSVSVGVATAFLAAFIVYLLQASVDWMWESTTVTALALAGIAAIGVRLAGPRPSVPVTARVALVVAALLAGVLQLPGMLSNAAIQHSESAVNAGHPSLALGWAQQAVDAEPWSASAYQQLGLVRESVGEFQAAADDLQAAISREPQNYDHWLILARIDTELGRIDPAVRAYDRARQLRPRASEFAARRGARP